MNFLTASVTIEVDDKLVKVQLSDIKSHFAKTAADIQSKATSMGATASAAFTKMGAVATRVFNSIYKYGRWALLAVVAATTLLIKSAMSSVDATAKLADRIGETTQNLAGLQYAASLCGSSVGQLDKSIEYLQKGLGEAAMGTGDVKKALDRMGISLEDMIKASPYQQILLISKGMQGIKSPAEKAALAVDLFGRSGVDMLNMLAEGPKWLQAMREEADKLGITFTRDMARKIEEANDAITTMRGAFKGLGIALAADLAPKIKEIAEAMTRWIIENREKIVSWFSEMITKLTALADWVWKNREGFAKFVLALAGLSVISKLTPLFVALMATGPIGLVAAITAGGVALGYYYDSLHKLVSEQTAWEKFWISQKEGWEEIKSGFESVGVVLGAALKKTEDLYRMQGKAVTPKTITGVEYLPGAIKEPTPRDRQRIMDLAASMRVTADVTKANVDATNKYVDSLQEITNKSQDFFKGFSDGIEQIKRDMITWAQVGKETADSVASNLGDALYQMTAEGAKFRNAMNAFFIDVLKESLRLQTQLIAQKLTTGAAGMVTSLLGGWGTPYGGTTPMTGIPAEMLHKGGFAGYPQSTRLVSPFDFTNAKRMHLGSDEVPAILQKGEPVFPKGTNFAEQKTPTIIVNVIDKTSAPRGVKANIGSSRWEFDRAVADVILRDKDREGPITQRGD